MARSAYHWIELFCLSKAYHFKLNQCIVTNNPELWKICFIWTRLNGLDVSDDLGQTPEGETERNGQTLALTTKSHTRTHTTYTHTHTRTQVHTSTHKHTQAHTHWNCSLLKLLLLSEVSWKWHLLFNTSRDAFASNFFTLRYNTHLIKTHFHLIRSNSAVCLHNYISFSALTKLPSVSN